MRKLFSYLAAGISTAVLLAPALALPTAAFAAGATTAEQVTGNAYAVDGFLALDSTRQDLDFHSNTPIQFKNAQGEYLTSANTTLLDGAQFNIDEANLPKNIVPSTVRIDDKHIVHFTPARTWAGSETPIDIPVKVTFKDGSSTIVHETFNIGPNRGFTYSLSNKPSIQQINKLVGDSVLNVKIEGFIDGKVTIAINDKNIAVIPWGQSTDQYVDLGNGASYKNGGLGYDFAYKLPADTTYPLTITATQTVLTRDNEQVTVKVEATATKQADGTLGMPVAKYQFAKLSDGSDIPQPAPNPDPQETPKYPKDTKDPKPTETPKDPKPTDPKDTMNDINGTKLGGIWTNPSDTTAPKGSSTSEPSTMTTPSGENHAVSNEQPAGASVKNGMTSAQANKAALQPMAQSAQQLAVTGSSVAGLALMAGGFVLAGGMVLFTKRTRAARH